MSVVSVSPPPLLSRATALGPHLAALSAVALLIVVATRPQGLHFFDQTLQVISLQQWLGGISETPNTLVRANPADLTRDLHEWLSWWPPSLQLLTAPLTLMGMTIGAALRIVFAVALLLGAIGWARWFRRFALPAAWLIALSVGLPWMRHASENAFRYSAEILSFGLAPWLLMLLLRTIGWIQVPGARQALRLALTGLALGCAYATKYSLFVVAVCGLGFVAWESRSAWMRGKRRIGCRCQLALLAATAFTVPVALRLLNATHGSADPVSHPERHPFDSLDLVFALANPPLALADAHGPLFHALVFPGILRPSGLPHGLDGLNLLAWLGLPAGLMLGWILIRYWRRSAGPHDIPGRLAIATLFLNTLVVFALWQFAEVDRMPRHIAPAAIAVLPLALQEGLAVWSVATLPRRLALSAAALVFIAGPLAYGFVYVAAKWQSTAHYVVGASGLYLPNLSLTDARAVAQAASRHATADSVWMVEDPEMAVELPGRFMLVYGDRDIGREMRRRREGPWRHPGDLTASRPTKLLMLLEHTGNASSDTAKARSLIAAIPKSQDWRPHHFSGANFILWEGRLLP